MFRLIRPPKSLEECPYYKELALAPVSQAWLLVIQANDTQVHYIPFSRHAATAESSSQASGSPPYSQYAISSQYKKSRGLLIAFAYPGL
jgi:hypothetical protein